jgi:eukaryotic-like serine/threonine-protein kinase
MNTPALHWQDLEADLDRLLALDEKVRESQLCTMAESDAARAAALRQWLADIAESEGLLELPPTRARQLLPDAPWRLLRQIGSGGMGEVWLAERADGAFERQVAIKFLRADRASLGERLMRERELLARLHHPGIAMLLDGGVSAAGEPYLVTEWINGARLDDWVRAAQPDLDARVDVLRRITEAVGYAHANLIVHRDLKPANVMIDRDGAPHLLDFGIARLLGEADGFTQTQDRALTPAFASPEQLLGQPITTRSDVYALGSLLYWLISARTPHDSEGLSLAELVKRVCEHDPPPPSALSKKMSTPRLADLDAIALKALARNPAARYPSADALANDLGRWREGETVSARLPTRVERVQRFVRRYRLVTALTTIIVLALSAGIAGTAWQARVAKSERDQAEQEAERNRLVRSFLMSVFRPQGDDESRITPSELLDRAAREVQQQHFSDPNERALLLGALSEIQDSRNNPKAALALLDPLLAADAQRLSPQSRARALCSRGSAQRNTGEALDAAVNSAREGMTLAESLQGSARDTLVSCLTVVGMIEADRGKFAEAIVVMERALSEASQLSGSQELNPVIAVTAGLLGNAYLYSSRYDDAIGQYTRGIEMLKKLERFESNEGAIAVSSLATAFSGAGRLAEADEQFAKALKMIDRHAGRNISYAMALTNFADLKNQLEQGEAARELVDQAIAIQTPIIGETGNVQGRALLVRGRAQLLLGNYQAAGADITRAETLISDALGAKHFATGRAAEQRANLQMLLGQPSLARTSLDSALEKFRAAGPAGERALSQALSVDAELRMEQGDWSGAQRSIDQSRTLSKKLLPEKHFQLLWLDALQAALLLRQGQAEPGRLEKAAAPLRAIFGANNSRLRRIDSWMHK